MLNRGGRFSNQIGQSAKVGVHTIKTPNWYVEGVSAYNRQSGNTRPANLPVYPVSLGANRGNHNPTPHRSSQGDQMNFN